MLEIQENDPNFYSFLGTRHIFILIVMLTNNCRIWGSENPREMDKPLSKIDHFDAVFDVMALESPFHLLESNDVDLKLTTYTWTHLFSTGRRYIPHKL